MLRRMPTGRLLERWVSRPGCFVLLESLYNVQVFKVFVMYVRTTDHVFKAQSRKIDDPAAFGNGLLRRAYSVLVSLPSGYASTRRGLPRLGFGPCGRM